MGGTFLRFGALCVPCTTCRFTLGFGTHEILAPCSARHFVEWLRAVAAKMLALDTQEALYSYRPNNTATAYFLVTK